MKKLISLPLILMTSSLFASSEYIHYKLDLVSGENIDNCRERLTVSTKVQGLDIADEAWNKSPKEILRLASKCAYPIFVVAVESHTDDFVIEGESLLQSHSKGNQRTNCYKNNLGHKTIQITYKNNKRKKERIIEEYTLLSSRDKLEDVDFIYEYNDVKKSSNDFICRYQNRN